MSIFKSFNTEDHVFHEKKSYFSIYVMIGAFCIAALGILLFCSEFKLCIKIYKQKENFYIISYDLISTEIAALLLSIFCLFGSLGAFSSVFLQKKIFASIFIKKIFYIPVKIVSCFTKVDNNVMTYVMYKNFLKKGLVDINKKSPPIKKTLYILAYSLYIFLWIYLLTAIFLFEMPNKWKFDLTNAFVTKAAGYKFCYGYRDLSNKRNTERYKIAYTLKDCQIPDPKIMRTMFLDFPS